MNILVTGGCGYIGSHVTRQLSEAGHRVTVVDNLSTGFREALLHQEELIQLDLSEKETLSNLLKERKFDAVLHFAASIIVPESVSDPLRYYRNNVVNAINLMEAVHASKVKFFIFSSTAAVYGDSQTEIVTEESPVAPSSPYGTSKLMTEWVLRDLGQASDLRHVILRYFNVAGADPQGRMGQRTKGATHLIKVANECALGLREDVTIFGDDYPTPDGTGVRDYIHVEDLAAAHLAALTYLEQGGGSNTFNCGYGHGFSVHQVLNAVSKAAQKTLPCTIGPRRPGDIGAIIADSSKLRATTGWQPQFDNLDRIVETSLAWEKTLQQNPEDPSA